ncbi:MAG: hypothetical protein KDB03_11550 [Planctomycetales bacterium]|nr:hypothetical protein [Planctomycetales bacterium]
MQRSQWVKTAGLFMLAFPSIACAQNNIFFLKPAPVVPTEAPAEDISIRWNQMQAFTSDTIKTASPVGTVLSWEQLSSSRNMSQGIAAFKTELPPDTQTRSPSNGSMQHIWSSVAGPAMESQPLAPLSDNSIANLWTKEYHPQPLHDDSTVAQLEPMEISIPWRVASSPQPEPLLSSRIPSLLEAGPAVRANVETSDLLFTRQASAASFSTQMNAPATLPNGTRPTIDPIVEQPATDVRLTSSTFNGVVTPSELALTKTTHVAGAQTDAEKISASQNAAQPLVAPEQLSSRKSKASELPSSVQLLEMEAQPALTVINLQSNDNLVDAIPSDSRSQTTPNQTNFSYVLQDLRNAVPAPLASSEPTQPINVLPIDRLLPTHSTSGAYDVAAMTGPMRNPGELFSRLNIDNDFRDQVGMLGEPVRTDMDEAGFVTNWDYQAYAWVNPNLGYNTLYFEQPNLERYGIGRHRYLQPIFSAAHFYGTVFAMPYKMFVKRPCALDHSLGHQRPGDCARYQGSDLLSHSYPAKAVSYFHK